MSTIVSFPVKELPRSATRRITLSGHSYMAEERVLSEHLMFRRIGIGIAGLPAAFHGYRIAHLSDLHFGPPTAYRTVMSALLIARNMNADLMALTGDFVSTYLDDFLMPDALDRLSARDGVWAVLGNHDHWTDATGVTRVLKQAGIRVMTNTNHRIERASDSLWVAGIDDLTAGHPDLKHTLEDIPDGATSILLAHEPDCADDVAATGRVALQLSGHYHGGSPRISVPGLRLFPGLMKHRPKYVHGLYHTQNMWVYTSAGAGRGARPRVGVLPEVTEITLLAESVNS